MRLVLTLLSVFCLSIPALPQTGPASPAPPTTVLYTSAQLVVVDVVVQDGNGKPVRGLTRDDFQILEDKAPQTVRSFEAHTTEAAAPSALPPLPPGVFTDYTPVKPNAPLTVILLDSLNTPVLDQTYVRRQLAEYVKHADPAAQIAIFGMNSHLILLQGFTGDPQVLRDAVEHKLTARSSPALDDATGTNTDPNKLSDQVAASANSSHGAIAQVIANLKQFEAEQAAFQTQVRTQYTLNAFNQLAHYLSAFSGRKNLIWFSGSFPLNILPDETIKSPFSLVASSDDEFRETTQLLTRAQVAVYPVDARSLMTNPVYSPSRSGSELVGNTAAMNKAISSFGQSQLDLHQTMIQMAESTGGHAFYNTNGLTQAVKAALDEGSNYYTLSYSPSNTDYGSQYRSIHVSLSGVSAARGLKLAYRHGYYAFPPSGKAAAPTAAGAPGTAATPAPAQANYVHAALARGAPAPSDLLFKLRVLPASATTEDKVAPNNQPSPDGKFKGPYRRYIIDIAAMPQGFFWTRSADGKHQAALTYDVLVYDADGALLNLYSQNAQLNVTSDEMKPLVTKGLQARLEVSAQAKGENYFRIALRDIRSNKIGVVEIPVSEVSRLAPPPATPNPATSPAPNTPSR